MSTDEIRFTSGRCDKGTLKSPCSGTLSFVECDEVDRRDRECGNKYVRCEAHGGMDGARRSLASHKGVYHPKENGR